MLTAVTVAFSSVLRSTGYVRVPMVISIFCAQPEDNPKLWFDLWQFWAASDGCRRSCNSYGHCPVVELVGMVSITYWKKLPAAAKISELISFNRDFLKRVLKTSLPVLANEMLWSFGITTYNMVYGRIGTEAIAAMNIAASIENLAFVIFIGVSEATGIMVGNRIGAGEESRHILSGARASS